MTTKQPKNCAGNENSQQRFYCDEMLKRVGRWLRAAGYDTVITNNELTDREMIRQAVDENRCLITRDRKLAEFRYADEVVLLLESNDMEQCIQELTQRIHINWLYRPFSRCLLCNTELAPAEANAWQRVPPESRKSADALSICPACDKLYWSGSHTRRMKEKLAGWQAM
ncbi:MAG: hypothetical protein BMS9Abin33_0464 [Gammaproteobacteria bacterium]|nr:MAG: hypothetical protein BMS9Abin33_0464 [Gammaproteobacteria bacterium]